MRKFFLIPVFVLMLCLACNRATTTLSKGEIIEITLKANNATPMPADMIFESAEYLRLETTDESLITNIDKMEIVGSDIYILDRKRETIFVFNENGTFIKIFKKQGRGPGEYLQITDFDVDSKYLYVTASVPEGVLRYDINTFNYVDNIAAGLIRGCNVAVNSNYLFVYSGNNRSEDLKDFAVIDKNSGKLVAKYRDLKSNETGWRSSDFSFAKHNDNVYCVLPFHYDIFKMETDGYNPIYSVDFGAGNMLPEGKNGFEYDEYDEFRASQPAPWDKPIYNLTNLHVTDKYFCFSFNYFKRSHLVVYSPENGSLRYGRVDGSNKMLLIGDIVYITEDDQVVMSRDASMLVDQLGIIQEINKEFIIPEDLLDVEPEDNPVLIFYKIKDE